MEFRILGPLEVCDRGHPLSFEGGKQRALLGVLLLHANKVVSSERLVDELWGATPPARATKLVQGYVSGVRKVLGRGRLLTQAPGYLVQLEADELDLHTFERLVAEARTENEPRRAAELLREALALWRGPALADLRFEAHSDREAERLNDIHLAALLERIDADLALGHHAQLVGELEALTAEHPLQERLTEQLMLALYRSGRQAEALSAYQVRRRTLVDELGVEPGQALRDLHQAILSHDIAIAAPTSRSAKRAARVSLPADPNRFVGRDHELDEIRAELDREDVRLLSLTGPGGIGKTRLALQAAAGRASAYGDGVCFVAFAEVSDAELVAATIAQSLGLKDDPSAELPATLRAHLAELDFLLVLDNVEHLLDGVVVFADLISACPRLQLLATSREPLRLAAEYEYPVPPLDEQEAIDLFRERARAVRRDFTSNGEVAEICRRLDALPLAVELAAAHARSLSAKEILARLDTRLPLLTEGPRDAPERQHTLHATIDWSYELLAPEEQRLFGQLSIFVGGCTLDAAETVCQADVDTLRALVDKNLLRHEADRYVMLETIRDYAAEQVHAGDSNQIRGRHADHFGSIVAEFERDHHAGRRQRDWYGWAAVEQDNVRAALAFLREAGASNDEAALWARMSEYWALRGRIDESKNAFERLLAGPLSASNRARVMAHLAVLMAMQGNASRAVELSQEAVAIARTLDDGTYLANALSSLAYALSYASELEASDRCYVELERLSRNDETAGWRGSVLNNLASNAIIRGEYETAIPMLEEAVELLAQPAFSFIALGDIALRQGRDSDALAHFAEGLRSAQGADYQEGIVAALEGIAAAVAQDNPMNAAQLLAAATAQRAHLGLAQEDHERESVERTAQAVLAALGPEKMDEARAAGATMTLEQAIGLALALAAPRMS